MFFASTEIKACSDGVFREPRVSWEAPVIAGPPQLTMSETSISAPQRNKRSPGNVTLECS